MVLENVGETPSDSFNNNPYPDQNDPYASSSSAPSSRARFDSSDFPRPVPILGTLVGFSESAVRFKTETTLKFAEHKLGRQLYPQESQALASHIYQLEATKSQFAATGATLGAWRAYSTMSMNRYPFYQPKAESIDPTKFAFVKGPMAPVVRQVWRFSLYVVVAAQMGSIIGQLIAQPLAARNTSRDPKLEQFGNELKAAVVAEQNKTAAQGLDIQERRAEFERQTRDRKGMGPPPQSSWSKQQSAARSSDDDVMSPANGSEAWETQSSASGSWDSFSSQGSQDRPNQSPDPSTNQAWDRHAPPKREIPSSLSPFDEDDASPTGGMFQDEVNNSAAQQQPRPGESAWERLRRGGAPIPGQRPTQQPRRAVPERREQSEGSALGDSFTSVEGEEGKKRERERAQREFDEQIERERQGRDFTGDEGKKW